MFNLITLEVMETFTSIKQIKSPVGKINLVLEYRKGDKISVTYIDNHYKELIEEGKLNVTYNMFEELSDHLIALKN